MVSEKKKQMLNAVKKDIENYSVIGMLDMYKLPARQLQQIRTKLVGKAVIKMTKKSLIKMALEESKRQGISELDPHIGIEPALLLSNSDPFELSRLIEDSKSSAFAKEGDVAPKDINIAAGPTSLKPGPVIGELQRVKIPAGVEGDKIVIRQDVVVAKEGQIIDKNLADVLAKLGIEPVEIGLNLAAIWENGIIYKKGLLFIPKERYLEDLKVCYSNAFNLALGIDYPTKETVPLLLSKAHQNAFNLAISANILTKETAEHLLQKAYNQMLNLKEKIPETVEKESVESEKLKETENSKSEEIKNEGEN